MAGLDYNALVEMIRNNIANVMTDPFYDGYDIEVTNEMQFLEKKEGYRNRIYIVVKFAPATTFFGQTVLSFTVTAISEHNHCFVCQKLLSDYAQKYNLEQTDYIQQIYETPSVILNFNEIYEGFAAVMAMSGTFVIAKDIARISFEYIYTDKDGNEQPPETVNAITNYCQFNNDVDSQAFYGTHDIADSIARIGSFSCGLSTYLFNNSQLIKDCLKLVQLAQKDATPLANIDKKFKIVVHFGNMLAMTVDMKLISFNSEASLGDLPIVSISFAK